MLATASTVAVVVVAGDRSGWRQHDSLATASTVAVVVVARGPLGMAVAR